MQVEGQHGVSLLTLMATGARVRNAYRTCPYLRDSLAKVRLILDGFLLPHGIWNNDLLDKEGGEWA